MEKTVVYPKVSNPRGELLQEDMRNLPSEVTTKDLSPNNLIHALDEKHIKEELLSDFLKKHQDKPTEASLRDVWAKALNYIPGEGEVVRLTQDIIDIRRLKVAETLLVFLDEDRDGFDGSWGKERIFYLWYPENDWCIYELRKGNPPSDADRPKHLKGMDLYIDLDDPFPKTLPKFVKNTHANMSPLKNQLGTSSLVHV